MKTTSSSGSGLRSTMLEQHDGQQQSGCEFTPAADETESAARPTNTRLAPTQGRGV
jgi:hypothetical protein